MSRPEKLNVLFKRLRSFKGVGPQVETAFKRLFGLVDGADPIALDVLMHMPFAFVDRSKMTDIAHAVVDEQSTMIVHVDKHIPAPRTNRPLPHKVNCDDESGELQLVFFGNKGGWLERALPVGERRVISGRVGLFQGQKQITHPELIVSEEAFAKLPPFEPIYPQTAGLNRRLIARIVGEVSKSLPEIDEWIPESRKAAHNWPGFTRALAQIHHPEKVEQTTPLHEARQRLAYDEYLAGQLTLQIVRSQMVTHKGIARAFDGNLAQKLVAALPFALTPDQQKTIGEIEKDLRAPDRMSRLVQGDVGAGKTLVALHAMVNMAEAGGQSALMAPTELLATQHLKTIAPLCETIGIKVLLLTGKMGAKDKRLALEEIESGAASIVIGTHALFQSTVQFNDLGLVVVDEQHRFGVHQRLALSDKGQSADLLVMTATPIPRTLVLTHFGDMAVSQIKSKPAGRQKIDTATLPIDQYDRVIARLRDRVGSGAQVYWVCPLVEESEDLQITSAEERAATLRAEFGDKVGLVHGRLGALEKQDVMDRFAAGELSILVATTVIEVGVDVPNATIMIVEHAERFGLSQLHQLRGRVGRGDAKSACLLLYKTPLGEIAQARLETIRDTDDGFEIAEKDLLLRGQGDLLGTKQSGAPGYALALPEFHGALLEEAHADAENILARNPGLTGAEGEALRELLYIFRRDLAIPLLRSG